MNADDARRRRSSARRRPSDSFCAAPAPPQPPPPPPPQVLQLPFLAPNGAFSSLPPAVYPGGGAEFPAPVDQARGFSYSYSCPSSGMHMPQKPSKSKLFEPHWPEAAVTEAIKKGKAFQGQFRVNVHNRLEAYCTVEGLPVDVLISGLQAQNRGIEGDTVALLIDPFAYWTRMKGPSVSCNHVSQDAQSSDANASGLSVSNNGSSEVTGQRAPFQNGTGRSSTQDNRNSSFCETVPCENGHAANFERSTRGTSDWTEISRALERIQAMIFSNPNKRPTGKVVSILKPSPRREAIVGFLSTKQLIIEGERQERQINGHQLKKNRLQNKDCIHLLPTDRKFPNMLVPIKSLPLELRERLKTGDETLEKDLIAARIDDWDDESLAPRAHVMHVLGRGGEIETHIGAILFENAICSEKFSPEALECIPDLSWKIPENEIKSRQDLRKILTFTIDPASAKDLDDALSIEILSDSLFRIGVHIADVSYFVHPDSAVDTEAQVRSTSVYILQHRIPMLPPELSEATASLNPGVDRLTFSIIWDIDLHGKIVNRWIGRSIISSCCKLSYDLVQHMIDENFDGVKPHNVSIPQLYGNFEWDSVTRSLKYLYEMAKKLKESRFNHGALELENAKLMFSFDEDGTPYDSYRDEKKEACSIVEEFMLLANRSAAEVISQAFPDSALLRRHPEPNLRRLKEFEAFCGRNGFELDASSSGQLHLSLAKIREKLKDDEMLLEILSLYASKQMQAAVYFSTGDLSERQNDWGHYALSVPLYTHFTSPLRRYPDIIVHRTLSAVIEAEDTYTSVRKGRLAVNGTRTTCVDNEGRVFTGLHFDKVVASSHEAREALSVAASKFKIPRSDVLGSVAAHCNERKFASRRAEEAGDKLYLWTFLKKHEVLFSSAIIMGVGPKFISVYVQKLACEKRIYCDEVEGLAVEWLDTTGVLVLDLRRNRAPVKRGAPVKYRAMEDVALLKNPSELVESEGTEAFHDPVTEVPANNLTEVPIAPAVLPLVLHHLSVIPVALHATGGDDGPLDFAVRLYVSSYFK